jgi:hypothetical protein
LSERVVELVRLVMCLDDEKDGVGGGRVYEAAGRVPEARRITRPATARSNRRTGALSRSTTVPLPNRDACVSEPMANARATCGLCGFEVPAARALPGR